MNLRIALTLLFVLLGVGATTHVSAATVTDVHVHGDGAMTFSEEVVGCLDIQALVQPFDTISGSGPAGSVFAPGVFLFVAAYDLCDSGYVIYGIGSTNALTITRTPDSLTVRGTATIPSQLPGSPDPTFTVDMTWNATGAPTRITTNRRYGWLGSKVVMHMSGESRDAQVTGTLSTDTVSTNLYASPGTGQLYTDTYGYVGVDQTLAPALVAATTSPATSSSPRGPMVAGIAESENVSGCLDTRSAVLAWSPADGNSSVSTPPSSVYVEQYDLCAQSDLVAAFGFVTTLQTQINPGLTGGTTAGTAVIPSSLADGGSVTVSVNLTWSGTGAVQRGTTMFVAVTPRGVFGQHVDSAVRVATTTGSVSVNGAEFFLSPIPAGNNLELINQGPIGPPS